MKKFRILMLIFVFIYSNIIYIPSARADAWGTAIAATYIKQALEQAYDTIKSAILGAAKTAALQAIDSAVSKLIGGDGGGSPKFITDWVDFVFTSAEEESDLIANNFITDVTRGAEQGLNYISNTTTSGSGGAPPDSQTVWLNPDKRAGDLVGSVLQVHADYLAAEGLVKNYPQQLAKQLFSSLVPKRLQSDLEEYCPDTTELFASGNMRCFTAFLQPNNNPHSLALQAQQIREEARERAETLAIAKAQAGNGYLAETDSYGNVITPAATIEALISDVKTLGSDLIANAGSIPELAVSIATRIASAAITEGIGKIKSEFERKVNSTVNNFFGVTQDQVNRNGGINRYAVPWQNPDTINKTPPQQWADPDSSVPPRQPSKAGGPQQIAN